MRRLVAAVAALALLAACSDDEPATEETSTTTTAPAAATSSTEPPPKAMLDSVVLDIEVVAALDQPIALAARPGSPDLYIAEKGGRVRLVEVDEEQLERRADDPPSAEEGADEPIDDGAYRVREPALLDLSDQVINEGERGLLGMTFSSDGRKLYLDYTRQPDGHTVVVEYTLGESERIDESSRRELLVVEQPFPNHNGGHLAIGPDGFLYIALGDGGDRGDPNGHAQDTSTLLGSILRIDPEAPGPDGRAYAIPPGNPFADGEDGAPEIWLYGVRNPWRFSFDGATGDLWVGDVGQEGYEEIDRLPADGGFDAGLGDNLGWDRMEGTRPYEGDENPAGAILPIFEYGRDQGCSVIGGYVYRGEQIPALQGTYLYSDLCGTGVRGLQVDGSDVIDSKRWDLPLAEAYSFGEGDDGEIYVLLAGGRVVKLVPG